MSLFSPASVAAEATVRAENLWRSYQLGGEEISVLRGVSLQIHQGEKVFLCGASGAGKTTLLYTLAGLEKPQKGSVWLGDESLYDIRSGARATLRNSKIGFIFQSYHLLPELTAMENVVLPAMLGQASGSDDRALALLERVGLADRVDHLPTQLSGGEQQRVAIARALINDPPFLFADEPTGNLDSEAGSQVMDILFSLVDESSKTLIVVTHDSTLARTGDRTLQLADGRIAKQV